MSATQCATFADRWQRAVRACADRPFLLWEDDDEGVRTWSYAEFDRLVASVSGALRAHEVRPGSAVHLALANSPAFVAVWLATTRVGAWVVPSDPRSTAAELEGHLRRTAPVLGVCAASRADVYREAAGATGTPVVALDESDTEVTALRGASDEAEPPGPLDRAAVMFTSGTTSAPKGVVVTQANYAFAGDVMASAAALRPEDRQLVVLPMFHANAQYYSFASAISVGASVALMSRFSATRFLEQAARHRATCASLFAAPMRMILARGGRPVDGVRLRHAWYAQNVSDDQYAELTRLFGCRPRQLYGMTETIPAVLSNPPLAPEPDAMGVPTLGCHVELRDPEDGRPVPSGAVGEVVVGGTPGVTLFAEYLDDPATTAASYRDGLFRTGDLARTDAAGSFRFVGRRGDVLKVAGENVSTVEVESVLAAHPGVLEAAVVGEPDPVRDEVPVAFVVQAPGKPPIDVAQLAEWTAGRLSPAKRPVSFTIVPELPRTSVGKVKKFQLRTPVTGSSGR